MEKLERIIKTVHQLYKNDERIAQLIRLCDPSVSILHDSNYESTDMNLTFNDMNGHRLHISSNAIIYRTADTCPETVEYLLEYGSYDEFFDIAKRKLEDAGELATTYERILYLVFCNAKETKASQYVVYYETTQPITSKESLLLESLYIVSKFQPFVTIPDDWSIKILNMSYSYTTPIPILSKNVKELKDIMSNNNKYSYPGSCEIVDGRLCSMYRSNAAYRINETFIYASDDPKEKEKFHILLGTNLQTKIRR